MKPRDLLSILLYRPSGWSQEELVEVRTALQPVISLEASLGEGTSELGEMSPDLSAEDPGEASAHSDARRRLAEALATLPEREQIVLSKRLGFDGDPQSLTTSGKLSGFLGSECSS